jgi:hypothetical protein
MLFMYTQEHCGFYREQLDPTPLQAGPDARSSFERAKESDVLKTGGTHVRPGLRVLCI